MVLLKLLLWNIFFWWNGYPHKDHCAYIFNKSGIEVVRGTYLAVAHVWAYDSTVRNIQDLAYFFTMSRTRAKCLLNKFVRVKTKKAP